MLGAGAWLWLAAGSLALGWGPDLGLGAQAPDGWSSDPSLAADTVLAPLAGVDSLLGALVFAVAAVALGWVLGARHAALALLGAMLWAAGVVAALGAVGQHALAEAPLVVVSVAATAVAIEFAVRARSGPGGARLRGAASPAFAPSR